MNIGGKAEFSPDNHFHNLCKKLGVEGNITVYFLTFFLYMILLLSGFIIAVPLNKAFGSDTSATTNDTFGVLATRFVLIYHGMFCLFDFLSNFDLWTRGIAGEFGSSPDIPVSLFGIGADAGTVANAVSSGSGPSGGQKLGSSSSGADNASASSSSNARNNASSSSTAQDSAEARKKRDAARDAALARLEGGNNKRDLQEPLIEKKDGPKLTPASGPGRGPIQSVSSMTLSTGNLKSQLTGVVILICYWASNGLIFCAQAPTVIAIGAIFFALAKILNYSTGVYSIQQLQMRKDLNSNSGNSKSNIFGNSRNMNIIGSSSSQQNEDASISNEQKRILSALTPYQKFYWVSIFGGILVSSLEFADSRLCSPSTGLNDPVCNLTHTPIVAVIVGVVFRLLFVAHWLQEIDTKWANKDQLAEMISTGIKAMRQGGQEISDGMRGRDGVEVQDNRNKNQQQNAGQAGGINWGGVFRSDGDLVDNHWCGFSGYRRNRGIF